VTDKHLGIYKSAIHRQNGLHERVRFILSVGLVASWSRQSRPASTYFFQAFVAPPQNLRAILLQTARYDFPVFYLRATAREAKLMDMLVLLTALFVRLNDHREERHQKPRRRDEETAATRQMFFDLRDFIRSGATFASLPNLEQQKIQRVIFDRVM
jgi:hypothetical protein